MSESLFSKIAIGLRQISATMDAALDNKRKHGDDYVGHHEEVATWMDRINGYAAEIDAHLAEPVEGTHIFDMIAAVELGNIETTETLIHMVAATVLAKLIEDEGGGRVNISFSPADMDAMHRDYEMETNRDGMITTVKLIPRENKLTTHQRHDVVGGVEIAYDTGLMTQEEDVADALPQVEQSVAKPYWFFNDGKVRQRTDDKETAQRLVFESKNILAHVENRMCSRAECPNSDMQGSCAACNPV